MEHGVKKKAATRGDEVQVALTLTGPLSSS